MTGPEISLKPCPKCGGVGRVHIGRASEDAMEAVVVCTNCSHQGDVCEDAYGFDAAATAIDQWNRREGPTDVR